MLSFFSNQFEVVYCSVVLCCDTYIKILDRVVIGAHFLTGGVFECNLTHRRSVSVLCMKYKIRCSLMLYVCRMCQSGLHAVLWSNIGILIYLLAAPLDLYSSLSVSVERSC